jgi:hypothetical protein
MLRRISMILAIAVLAGGCWWNDSSNTGTDSSSGDSSATGSGETGGTSSGDSSATNSGYTGLAQPDNGCTLDQPRTLSLTNEQALLIEACTAEDGTSRLIKNISAAVLWIGPASSSSINLQVVLPPENNTLAAAAMRTAVENSGADADGGVFLVPGERVIATSDNVVYLKLEVMPNLTISAYAARLAAEWVQEKFQSPGRGFANNVAQCAQAAGNAWAARSQSWQQVIGETLRGAPDCKSLYNQVDDALHEEHRPPSAVA